MEKIVCIYKITNTITGDFYIGQTRDLDRRIREHKVNPPPNMKEDVKEYGWGAFKFEILEECSEDILTEKENFYISTLKPPYNRLFKGCERSQETRQKISETLIGHEVSQETRMKLSKSNSGKNMSLDTREKISRAMIGKTNGVTSFLGQKHTLESRMKMSKPVICVETNEVFWSIDVAAKRFNISSSNIDAVLNGRQLTAAGFHWRYVDEQSNIKIRTNDKRNKFIICKEDGKIFDSIEQAASVLGLNPCGILHVLKGRTKTCGGFHFEYVNDSPDTESNNCSLRMKLLGTKPVPIICLETGKIYPTIKVASKEIKVASQSISAVLNGRRMTAGGFHWKYLDDRLNVPEKESTSNAKPVFCVETGQIFSSIKATADAFNFTTQSISAVLKGKGITAGGYHFKYVT